MERYRNNQVRIAAIVYSFQSEERQRKAQVGEPIVFERVNQVANRPFVEKGRPCSVEVRRVGQTRAAAVIVTHTDKGYSADGAER